MLLTHCSCLASTYRRIAFHRSAHSKIVPRLLVVVLIAVGCNSESQPRGEVHGAVTAGGRIVEVGSILFEPIDGTRGPSAGGPIEDGKYHIPANKGPMPGSYRVSVRGWEFTGRTIKMPPDSYNPEGEVVNERREIVPPLYYTASPLKTEIEAGENTFNIEVPGNFESE